MAASRRFRDHFSSAAPDYVRFRPRYPQDLADYLSSLAPATSLVWEAGCGSGQLSMILSRLFACVVASDASVQQIAAAPRRPRLQYLVELAEASALADGVASLCVSAQAAHWFDLDGYYSEVARVGRRGGVVAAITYGRVAGPPELAPLLEHFHEAVLAPHWPRGRAHVEEGYRTLPFPFDEIVAPVFALRQDWSLESFLGYVSTWSAVQGLRSRGGEAAFAEFAAAVRAEWIRGPRLREFRWPVTLRVGSI